MGFGMMALGDKMRIANTNLHRVLMVCAAYGIIQVLAQDLGIKTGKKQRDLVQTIPVQMIVFYSAAYFVTDNYFLAFIAMSMYFFLKYVYSEGETSTVCFEDLK